MRVTVALLGWTFDVSLSPDAAEEATNSLDGGGTFSTPVGFTHAYPVPEEVPAPQHCPSWDEPEQ
jgi:hypothetical protein